MASHFAVEISNHIDNVLLCCLGPLVLEIQHRILQWLLHLQLVADDKKMALVFQKICSLLLQDLCITSCSIHCYKKTSCDYSPELYCAINRTEQ